MSEQLVSKEEIAEYVRDMTDMRKDAHERNQKILAERHAVRLDENGREVLDPTPAEVPLGHERPATLQEQIARLLVKPPVASSDDVMDGS